MNDYELVEKLLKNCASIVDQDLNVQTPLSLAFDNEHDSMIDLMFSLYNFENIDVTNADEIIHFHIACWRSNLDIVQKFVKNGMSAKSSIDVNSKRWPGFTPLHLAIDGCMYSVEAVVDFLLERGANFSAQDAKGRSPLHLAYDKSKTTPMKTIINNIIDKFILSRTFDNSNPVDDKGISHYCIASSTRELPHYVWHSHRSDKENTVPLDSGDFSGYSPLHFALENRNSTANMIRILCHYVDVNLKAKGGSTPLHLAVKNNCKLKIIGILLEHKANISIQDDHGNTPLHCAFYATTSKSHLYSKIIKLLLKYCSTTENPSDNYGVSHFHIACVFDDLDVVKTFIENGVSLNSYVHSRKTMWFGFTALYFAIAYNQPNCVELLLQSKADMNSKLSEFTALNLACNQQHFKYDEMIESYDRKPYGGYVYVDFGTNSYYQIEIVKLLLKYGADVDTKDSRKMTPLMRAYQCNLHSNVNSLTRDLNKHLSSGEETEGSECDGNFRPSGCPLWYNVKKLCETRKRIIRLLLSHNPDVNIRTPEGGSILHYICQADDEDFLKDQEEIAEMFLSKGADVDAVDRTGRTPIYMAVENG